ncbi:MAG: TPM domain-containing protein, partial [Bacteroidota bacterium]
RCALLGAIKFFVLVILFDRFFPELAIYDPLLIFIIVLTGGLLGFIVSHFVPFIKRLLITKSQQQYATRQRAENAFLQEEVFNTRHRTGIMLFVSFFEHEVIIMADRGIAKVVDQQEWDRIVKTITDGISSNNLIGSMETAIARCGEILREKGFIKSADDINELPDNLRVQQ